MQALVLVMFALVSCAAVRAQRTWVVDWLNRAGTDFAAIQPAVDAAAPGDTILVRGAGLYPEPPGHAYAGPTIDGKGIRVIGEGAATTWIVGPWTIRNVPATQSVTLASFQCGFCCLLQYLSGMTLTNNAGLVAMSDIVFESYGTKDFTDCAAVIVSNCSIQLFCGFRAIRSNLMLDGISINPLWYSTAEGSALYCERSKVWIANSIIAGADQVYSLAIAQPAIRSKESELWIGRGAVVRGGLALAGYRTAINDAWVLVNSYCGGSCGFIVQPSRYHLDPLAQMFGTYATWTPDDVRPITSVWAVESAGTLTVSQRCAPGSLLVLGIGPLLLPPIQDLNGMLAVDPAQALL